MTSVKRHATAALATLAALVAALVAVLGLATAASAYTGTGGGANTGGVSVGSSSPSAGGSLVVNGNECRPDSTVTITLDGTETLGTAQTDANGAYSTTVTVPSGTSGSHDIVIQGAQCAATAGIEVQNGSSSNGGSSGGGNLAGTGVAVVGIGALGVVLLIGGGLMLLAGKRRKVSA